MSRAGYCLEEWKQGVENTSMPYDEARVLKLLSKEPFETWPHRPYWGLILRLAKDNHLEWLQGFHRLGLPLDPRSSDTAYECAWFCAVQSESLTPTLKWLLDPADPKININAHEGEHGQGGSALMYGIRYFNFSLELFEFLLNAGADPNHETDQGMTFLLRLDDDFNHYTYESNEEYRKQTHTCIRALLAHGLDIHRLLSTGKSTVDSLDEEQFKKVVLEEEILYLQSSLGQSLPTPSNASKASPRL